MKSDLARLVLVRDLRTRLAQTTVLRLQQAVTRAQVAIDAARVRKVGHEAQAAEASAAACAERSDDRMLAADMHRLLDFAAGQRFKAHESAAQMRRAELVRQRAQEEVDGASDEWRRQALRRERVSDHAKREQSDTHRKLLEREDESIAEARTTHALAVALTERADARESRGRADE